MCSREHLRALYGFAKFHGRTKTLSLGCGEILPIVLQKWDTMQSEIHCVDVSNKSLQRLKFRMFTTPSQKKFFNMPLENFFKKNTMTAITRYDYVDIYGVLHHLSDPQSVLMSISSHLLPFGVGRAMIYNSAARHWIIILKKIFRILEIDYLSEIDLKLAQEILKLLAQDIPALKTRLDGMKGFSHQNLTWFADTFLHPHELQTPWARWVEMFKKSDLNILGIYDRYAELDDLPNPLWKMPEGFEITERLNDFRFENNFEIFFCKENISPKLKQKPVPVRFPLRAKFAGLPQNWFQYNETKNLNPALKKILHKRFLENSVFELSELQQFPLPALQRLGRLGIIRPNQIHNTEFYTKLLMPMTEKMQAPVYIKPPARLSESLLNKIMTLKPLGNKQKCILSKRLEELRLI